MKVGVPGEFHEDRWQRIAEDSERRVIPLTREAGSTHRIQVIAWRRGLLDGLRHGDHAHKYSSGILAWRRGSSNRSSAQRPCPQVPQCHPRVAKGSSGRSSARPAVSIFGERGDTLRPARTSAYSAPWISRARRRRGMAHRHIHRAPWISRARRRRGCRLCPSHRRGCCRSGWRGWSG